MRIDWFTFGAQIFNFVLLVFLLKKFLYRPVLDAIERREDGIRGRMEEAHQREDDAERKARELNQRREELEERRVRLLREAEQKAEEHHRKLKQEVREEVETMRRQWHEALRREKETFLEELERRASRQLYDAVRRVLRELADTELEERIVTVFLRRLERLEDAERGAFREAVVASDARIRVRSAFSLDTDARSALEDRLREWTTSELELHFEEDPALVLGVEVVAGDRKIAWSVRSYLETLEAETAGYLEARVG